METNEVGKIICILRKRLNITQQALCRGLCSVSKISRIESGERMPDMLLMEALFQRLGKSPDKIEMMLSERDYTLCGIRMEIELALLRRDYLEAESQLNLYAKQKEAKHTLHSQYLYKMKGVLQREAYHDSKKSMEYLKKAVLLTLPNFESEKIEKCLLSVREIQLLLLLAQNEMEEQEDEAIALMAELKIYLDKNYTDEEEKVKIYPKVAYLLAKALVKKKHYEEASKLCEKAMDLLGNGGVTICLLEIVQLQIECFRDRGNKKRLSLLIQEKESLESLYKKYDMEIPKNEINIWEENTQREIYLIHELLKKSRIKKKMTQENLTNEIDIEQETISRIETGKRPPSRQTFQRMKDELGIDRTYYMGYISADEFEIHEKKREISKLIFL
ncbi:MAG: helix-turn-helix transcriptional regulator, partial [Acetivibrio sp.]